MFRDKDGRVEKLLTNTSIPNGSAKPLVPMSKLGPQRINPGRDVEFSVNSTAVSSSGVSGDKSPFRTPPSLSFRQDKVTYFIFYWSL